MNSPQKALTCHGKVNKRDTVFVFFTLMNRLAEGISSGAEGLRVNSTGFFFSLLINKITSFSFFGKSVLSRAETCNQQKTGTATECVLSPTLTFMVLRALLPSSLVKIAFTRTAPPRASTIGSWMLVVSPSKSKEDQKFTEAGNSKVAKAGSML